MYIMYNDSSQDTSLDELLRPIMNNIVDNGAQWGTALGSWLWLLPEQLGRLVSLTPADDMLSCAGAPFGL